MTDLPGAYPRAKWGRYKIEHEGTSVLTKTFILEVPADITDEEIREYIERGEDDPENKIKVESFDDSDVIEINPVEDGDEDLPVIRYRKDE